MTEPTAAANPIRLNSPSGLSADINANGSIRRFDCGPTALTLFVGNEVEGGPANLYLRRLPLADANAVEWTPLLGPQSRTRFFKHPQTGMLAGVGSWQGINYTLSLVLAVDAPAWFWHVTLENTNPSACDVDLTYVQDLALAPYGAVRMNEYYVSQYIDHTGLNHPVHGFVTASRQNQAADGRHPWCLIGSLRAAGSFGTDAMQFHGLATRRGAAPAGLISDLPSRRLQQEHSMVALRDTPLTLEPARSVATGFFGTYLADHPEATSPADLDQVGRALALPESQCPAVEWNCVQAPELSTLFSCAPRFAALDLDAASLATLFGSQRRHEEVDAGGGILSFFHGADSHVVLKAKEERVQRPHGQLLRTGRHLTPDETALTSTAWMSGVFHSMVTQGHVSINRMLSTVHSYLGLFCSHGQRVFVQTGRDWVLLDLPSAFEMDPNGCRWIYRHEHGVIQVRAAAVDDPHAMTLSIEVASGEPTRFLITHHMALNGDDGSEPGPARWLLEGNTILAMAAPDSDVGRRFPNGSFRISPAAGTQFQQVCGDEILFTDGRSRNQPFICVVTAPATQAGLSIRGQLVAAQSPPPLCLEATQSLIPTLKVHPGRSITALNAQLERLADIAPWFTQNALVHYLSPRGLEQYSGGGWGTRDVCQGPVEMLLALGRIEPIRDLLLRVMATQNPDGDWPQWFMFFERERNIRPGDSHGDIVLWPILVLAQYLLASGDGAVLDESVPFFDSRGAQAAEQATVWQHAQRALSVIEKRVIPGTRLAAYGHGDWNDSLQPADPALRERMCSAWTVTLHFQTLVELGRALRTLGRADEAAHLETWAQAIARDFQRLLVVDGVLAGYAHFEDTGSVRYLLHPSDSTTGIRYSSLAMIHAILEDLLTPQQTREHLRLIDEHLNAPDGVHLFDRPMPYRGGPERIFQRAESATYFGREIGLMYTHAHLRYAQALAHVGEAEKFFAALCQANPIGIRSIVPMATLRQSNCYYSSSDAAFADRYQASAEYGRVAGGTIALDGGWRVYSSGAGIAVGLIVRRFLGFSCESQLLRVDPVIPSALDGMRIETTLMGRAVTVQYGIGKSGCGVAAIALNGQPLAFTVEANPHRRGAALVAMKSLVEGLTLQQNVLKIDLG